MAALGVALALTLALAGCGRKVGLDAPPSALAEPGPGPGANAQPAPGAPPRAAARPVVADPLAQAGTRSLYDSFFLDWLIK
ncbi:MAG: hypothetical protein HY056_07740 [Proteobacteria bacterium]|nr:hypothetical protein [Pseudomonadota bacterium]